MSTSLLSRYGLAIVLVFITVEALVSFFRKDEAYERKDTAANVGIGVVGTLIGLFLWSGVAYAAYTFAFGHRLLTIPLDRWWGWALLVLAADLAWYVEHRVGHKARLFWAVHSVHHSSEKFNYSVALRLPWLGGLTRIPFLLPLAFVGFPPVAVMTGFSIVFLYQIWVHTEYVGKIGALEEVLNTPSHHRVHHAKDARYLDKNYGGILIVWDRLFGTFQREDAPAHYGILHPIGSHDPVRIQSRDLLATFRALFQASSPREALRITLGDPAYIPLKQIRDSSPAPQAFSARNAAV